MKLDTAVLKRARILQGMTQVDLAKAMKSWPQTVRAWESGKTMPRPATFRRLSRVLRLKPRELLSEDDK